MNSSKLRCVLRQNKWRQSVPRPWRIRPWKRKVERGKRKENRLKKIRIGEETIKQNIE
jgi:hypothetical protein